MVNEPACKRVKVDDVVASNDAITEDLLRPIEVINVPTKMHDGGTPRRSYTKKKACEEPAVKVHKSYRNDEFLNSSQARLIRVMCELEEPGARMAAEGVDNIVMFFGSARAKPKAQYATLFRASSL